MNNIIRGTTPTISITFNATNPADIVNASLNVGLISRDLSTAQINGRALTWTLTQEETLTLQVGNTIKIVCVWVTRDGTRGQSYTGFAKVDATPVNEVME